MSLPLFEREISRVSVFRPVSPFAASSLSLFLSCFHVVTRIFAFQGPREREREREEGFKCILVAVEERRVGAQRRRTDDSISLETVFSRFYRFIFFFFLTRCNDFEI